MPNVFFTFALNPFGCGRKLVLNSSSSSLYASAILQSFSYHKPRAVFHRFPVYHHLFTPSVLISATLFCSMPSTFMHTWVLHSISLPFPSMQPKFEQTPTPEFKQQPQFTRLLWRVYVITVQTYNKTIWKINT